MSKQIIVKVKGGAVRDVIIPEDCNIEVQVRDYDIDDATGTVEDKDGIQYVESNYS